MAGVGGDRPKLAPGEVIHKVNYRKVCAQRSAAQSGERCNCNAGFSMHFVAGFMPFESVAVRMTFVLRCRACARRAEGLMKGLGLLAILTSLVVSLPSYYRRRPGTRFTENGFARLAFRQRLRRGAR